MNKTFLATPGVEAAPGKDEGAILYSSKTSKFIMLNRSAARLWSELSTPKTEEELVKTLCATFPDVAISTAQRDVSDMLEQLKEFNLVTVSTDEVSVGTEECSAQVEK